MDAIEPGRVASVPTSAAWLGGLGALPFVTLAGGALLSAGEPRALMLKVLLAYGAAILSFLGGIHWGLAIGAPAQAVDARQGTRLCISVLPSLVAWLALLVPAHAGLFVLAASFGGMLWLDLRLARSGLAPAWYPGLRIPLSCTVVGALLVGTLA